MDRSSDLISYLFKEKYAFFPHLRLLLQIRLVHSQISAACLLFFMRVKTYAHLNFLQWPSKKYPIKKTNYEYYYVIFLYAGPVAQSVW